MTKIKHILFDPVGCPICGARLVVAISEQHRNPTPRDPEPSTRWIGYDCQSCGEQLRFDEE